jgi:hypothetical protein
VFDGRITVSVVGKFRDIEEDAHLVRRRWWVDN